VLQSFHLGHCTGQFNQVDLSASSLVQDLDAGYQVVCKTSLNGAIGVDCGTSHGKSFFSCGHNVAFQSLLTEFKKCFALLLNISIL
jgi:hypothetical protein